MGLNQSSFEIPYIPPFPTRATSRRFNFPTLPQTVIPPTVTPYNVIQPIIPSERVEHIYILQLEHGYWYIGRTTNIQRRYIQHTSGKGAKWTFLHKPIKIHETIPLKSEQHEDGLTIEYMKKYGIRNVRGGRFCQVELKHYNISEIERLIAKSIKNSNTSETVPENTSEDIKKYKGVNISVLKNIICNKLTLRQQTEIMDYAIMNNVLVFQSLEKYNLIEPIDLKIIWSNDLALVQDLDFDVAMGILKTPNTRVYLQPNI